MIVLDNLVEKLVELGVRVMGAGIEADSGVEVLNTGEDAGLEGNSLIAGHVLVLLENFLGQALREL